MDEVIGGLLYISGITEASNQSLLQQNNIAFVVNATHRENNFDTINYLHCPVSDCDDEDIYQYFEPTRIHIEKAKASGKACLVHCMAGISRSATLVISYLMLANNLSLHNAWELLISARKDIQPNDGFWSQLVRLEEEKFGFASLTLVEYKLSSLAIEFEDYVTKEELRELYDKFQDIEELDEYLLDKYLTLPTITNPNECIIWK